MLRLPGRAPKPATSARLPDSGPVAELPGCDRLLVWACMVAITALAWGYLFYLDHQMASAIQYDTMMAEMGMSEPRAWTRADVFFTFAMWIVMMAAMMTASAAPVLLLYAGLHARLDSHRVPLIVLLFGLGYLAVWVAFSACATIAQWAMHEAAMLSPAMAMSSREAGGMILFVAGAYQLTPLKRACLMHCRSPLGFLMTHWRDGKRGALEMGVRHGAFCLGCCWALMCVLFVSGVMTLLWVAILALLVMLEKLGPGGTCVARVGGVAMIVLGAWYLAGVR
ncbi:hypothetical protein ASL20_32800 [Cupriavidus necator]|nr:hypothetical protein ASL20_32800 [Cupriavidus necator]